MAGETIGSLIVRIEANLQNLEAGLNRAGELAGKAGSKIKSRLDAAVPASEALAGGITLVGAAIGAFGIKSLTMAGQMESVQVAFTTMLGSAEKAKNLMVELQRFGAQTPFEFPEIQKSAKSLLAFGVAQEDMIKTLTKLGDVSSGVGMPLNELAELFGKAKTQGRLFGEDINQLTGRGIPIIGELAKQFGVAESEVKKLVEEGKVGFPEIDKAFDSMTAKGSKFGGMMEAQSKTLPGMWSNLMDAIGQSSTKIGEELIKTFDLKTKLQGAVDALGKLSALLQAEGLKGALEKIFPENTRVAIVAVAGAIMGGLVPALYAAAAGFWAALSPLLPFMAAGAAVAGLAYLIYTNWEPIKKFFVDIWNSIKTTASDAWNSVKTTTLETWNSITDFFTVDIPNAFNNFVDFVAKLPGRVQVFLYDLFMVKIPYAIGYGIGYMIKTVSEGIPKLIQWFADLPGKIWVWLQATILKFITWSTDIGAKATATGKSILDNIISFVKNLPSSLWNLLVTAGQKLAAFLTSAKTTAKDIGKAIFDGIVDFVTSIPDKIAKIFTGILDAAKKFVEKIKATISSVTGSVKGGIEAGKSGTSSRGVPGFAKGINNFRGGMAIVGERGPELLNLPRGSQVIPNKQTEAMMGQALNFEGMFAGANFYVRSDNDIKLIAREIHNMQTVRARAAGVVYST